MTTLAFDGRTGASGDVLLGALVAAGADPDVLSPVEAALPVQYDVDAVVDAGIEATRVRVLYEDDEPDATESSAHDAAADREHDATDGHHDATDGHHDATDGHHHSTDDHHGAAEGHGPHRTCDEVREIVATLDVPASVEADALAIVELLGRAEASVHGTDLDETRFHEVGADDAIADVVGAALLVDDLDVDRVVTTLVHAGGGEVETSHGTYPVPPPAVVAVAERADWALTGGPVDRELLTPTGAAILAHFAEGVDRLPPLRVADAGYGAGSYDLGDRPNVLRAVVGEERGALDRESISVLETNVDDVSPEVLGDLQASLAAVGAKDVTVVPTTMKKARPGHLVKVIVDPADAERVARRLAAETGTLGVREAGAAHRWTANRRLDTVTVELEGRSHDVRVKVGTDDDGAVLDVSAEYDDAAAVAREVDAPLREVARRAETAARDVLDADDERA